MSLYFTDQFYQRFVNIINQYYEKQLLTSFIFSILLGYFLNNTCFLIFIISFLSTFSVFILYVCEVIEKDIQILPLLVTITNLYNTDGTQKSDATWKKAL